MLPFPPLDPVLEIRKRLLREKWKYIVRHVGYCGGDGMMKVQRKGMVFDPMRRMWMLETVVPEMEMIDWSHLASCCLLPVSFRSSRTFRAAWVPFFR